MEAGGKTMATAPMVIDVPDVEHGAMTISVVGTKPIILNRMSEKAKNSLISPRRMTASEKGVTAKHDPMAEFRASPYIMPDDEEPTLLALLGSMFKGAMRTAALDLPGTKKTQIGRLTHVEQDRINLYGVPQMLMSVVRSADINRTPDIRSRAIVPQWACQFVITYVKPMVNETVVMRLLHGAGITAGVGDWRPEKGAGNHGQFRLADADDPELLAILKAGGRKVQGDAMESPTFYDLESEELFEWWSQDVQERGLRAAV